MEKKMRKLIRAKTRIALTEHKPAGEYLTNEAPTGELSLPLREALLLHGVQVGQVVMFVFQGILLQAKSSQTSGCVSACKHSIRPLCETAERSHTVRWAIAQGSSSLLFWWRKNWWMLTFAIFGSISEEGTECAACGEKLKSARFLK